MTQYREIIRLTGLGFSQRNIMVNITVQMYPCSEGTDTGSPAL